MLKKLGVMAIGVTAGLVAAAPLASAAEEAGATQTSSDSPAVQAPVGDGSVVGTPAVDGTDLEGLLESNGQSLSGNGTFVNGHDMSF